MSDEPASELLDRWLGITNEITDAQTRTRRRLLRMLCDRYAAANFGDLPGRKKGLVVSLDDGDRAKALADIVCTSLGINTFDHHALEEAYAHLVSKDETPAQRAIALAGRDYQHLGSDAVAKYRMAYKFATQIAELYGDFPKQSLFWKQVAKALHEKMQVAQTEAVHRELRSQRA